MSPWPFSRLLQTTESMNRGSSILIRSGLSSLVRTSSSKIAELEAHVLNGACPFAAAPARRGEPVRFRREKAPGRVVGFFTTLPAGTLTHHGSRLHVHVLPDEGPMTGHVDRMVIEGTLRVPAP